MTFSFLTKAAVIDDRVLAFAVPASEPCAVPAYQLTVCVLESMRNYSNGLACVCEHLSSVTTGNKKEKWRTGD